MSERKDVPAKSPGGTSIDALARLIEYASLEAKEAGLRFVGELLDLAVWSLADVKAYALTQQRSHLRLGRGLIMPEP